MAPTVAVRRFPPPIYYNYTTCPINDPPSGRCSKSNARLAQVGLTRMRKAVCITQWRIERSAS